MITIHIHDLDFTREKFANNHPEISKVVGDDNPLWPLINEYSNWGLHLQLTPDNTGAFITGIEDTRILTPQIAFAIVAAGMEITGYPAFLKLAVARRTELVPDYISGAYHLDESETPGPTTLKTWEEWADNYRVANGFAYIQLRESVSVLRQLNQNAFTLMTERQARTELADLTP